MDSSERSNRAVYSRNTNQSQSEIKEQNKLIPDLFLKRDWRFVALLGLLCGTTYLPALNNGFISDDFIMLEWLREWREDFTFLLKLAPDVFRLTSYIVLGCFKAIFGYRAEYFYAFSILVHFTNCILLWKLVGVVIARPAIARLAAVLFAVVHKPSEAVMWVAAMADALSGLCVLFSLLLWTKGRHVLSSLFYLLGLFSKESALVTLLLVPLMDFWNHRRISFRPQYLHLLLPSLIFSAVFAVTVGSNHMVYEGLYAFGFHGLLVLARSLERLMLPSLGVAMLLFLLTRRRRLPFELVAGFTWMFISLLPFIFLTYMDHVPSRQVYLASMGLAFTLSVVLANLNCIRLQRVFLVAFVVANMAYVWFVKDLQFLQRAAPTTNLLRELRARAPERILVTDFPLNPWMAKMTARLAPGWEPELIEVNPPQVMCARCPIFRWNGKTESYEIRFLKSQ